MGRRWPACALLEVERVRWIASAFYALHQDDWVEQRRDGGFLVSDAAGRKPTTSFSSFFLISIYVHVAGMRAKADDYRSPSKIGGNCKRARERKR